MNPLNASLTQRLRSWKKQSDKGVGALLVGNALEWFDFALYGFFATSIARHFFANDDAQAAALGAAATFGAAFLMRPLGAVLIGRMGDRHGRKQALVMSFGLMALGTAMIGLTPTVASAGMAATVIVVVGRLLQGFSAAGEAGSSLTMMMETVPPDRQGRATALLTMGAYGGLMLGSLSGLAINTLLTPEQAQAWGWRLPFIAGLLIFPIGLHLRREMRESPAFAGRSRSTAPAGVARPPAAESANLARGIATMIGLSGFASPILYLILVFMPTQATDYFGVNAKAAMTSTTIALAMLLMLLMPMGRLVDHIGGKSVMFCSSAVGTLLVVPLTMLLVQMPDFAVLLLLQGVLVTCLAAYVTGCGPVASSLFAASNRTFGMSVGYNLGIVLFGAFAPLVTTWIFQKTGNSLTPAWYVLAASVISVGTVLTLQSNVPPKSLERV